jgi:glycosyltransferase involved in cell wall biosynthesis
MSLYQGTDLLLDCIEILKSKGTKVHFLIMGFPCERYCNDAQARGISEMITFTGKVDYKDAPHMLSSADIAITPKLSLTEANGKIFNYMACGLPVVAFDTAINREILADTGVYASYGDANDLAQKIIDLLTDDKLRLHLSHQVRERAKNKHSWVSRGNLLSDTYRLMLRSQNNK